MKKVIAFADEFGNNSFDFKSQGSHFIVASVIINLNSLEDANFKLEQIRVKFFQTGEIKSSKVADNHKRRLLILSALQTINFSIYSVVVDKERLFGEGFKYKQSFYKYLNGILYKELYRTFPQLSLKVDEHGGNAFMTSFKKYVEANHIRDLFEGSDFNIDKSHDELGIQLADFIAGTLGYIFDRNKKSDFSEQFFNLLSHKLISINHFPKKYSLDAFSENNPHKEYNESISTLSLNRILDFIERTDATSDEKRDQLNLVKLLLFFHQSNQYTKYTTAAEFMKHLNVNREKEMRKEQFTSLVGSLRDKGILIASSRDGYKVPVTVVELKRYVRHGNSIILPLLRRIDECRKTLLLATNNSFDILGDSEFKRLEKLIESIK